MHTHLSWGRLVRSIALPLCLLVVGFSLPVNSIGGEASPSTLGVGSPAPLLKVGKWIKGTPIPNLQTGRVYVVEFWATWCGPCRTTVPHLTELARRYKDRVTVVGVSIGENEDKEEARYAAVAAFVKGMGSKMEYNVAADTQDGWMSSAWLDAAKQDGIPTAFIIGKDGKIAWIGNPLSGLDQAVARILKGS